ncbi:MAG: flagellar motor stator protein MotA [Bacillota bacterium]|nr:flagellar motor stator protein MotA [Bacillota bacterium]
MDIFLILGIILGFVSVIVGMIVKGADVSVLLNPAAAIIILVGTLASVINSFPKSEFLNIPRLLLVLFSEKRREDPCAIIRRIIELARTTRKSGLLSLDKEIPNMDNQFMQTGLEMLVDGIEPEYIREALNDEIESMEERHRSGAMIFSTAGSSAPTLGVLGAVVGLIGALGNLNDTVKLAHMIAAAFVATLYGIFFGYIICHPFATRLKRKSQEEVENMELILEGILLVQEGKNPNAIEKKLLGMLKPKDRKRYRFSREIGKGEE